MSLLRTINTAANVVSAVQNTRTASALSRHNQMLQAAQSGAQTEAEVRDDIFNYSAELPRTTALNQRYLLCRDFGLWVGALGVSSASFSSMPDKEFFAKTAHDYQQALMQTQEQLAPAVRAEIDDFISGCVVAHPLRAAVQWHQTLINMRGGWLVWNGIPNLFFYVFILVMFCGIIPALFASQVPKGIFFIAAVGGAIQLVSYRKQQVVRFCAELEPLGYGMNYQATTSEVRRQRDTLLKSIQHPWFSPQGDLEQAERQFIQRLHETAQRLSLPTDGII